MKDKSKATQSKTTRVGIDRVKLVSCILVALFFGLALFLRTVLPYDQIFTQSGIKFSSNDAYYYMRIVDNIVYNFPGHMQIDPYYSYPAASGPVMPTFFSWLLASVIWIIGLGSPSQHMIDVIGVFFPAVLGALTVIPVYFIGKELIGRWAGILAACLIAIMPGEFMGRSILGFTDQHVAETLLTTVTVLFLILAIKTVKGKGLSFDHVMRRDWRILSKPLIYSLVAGFFLGTYLLTWLGALLFVFIIAVFFIIQFVIDHLRGRSTDYLCLVGITCFFVALIMSLFNSILRSGFYLIPLITALLIPPALSGIARLMTANKLKVAYYPLSLLGLGLIVIGVLYLIDPYLLRTMVNAFSVFAPQGAQLTTIEMQRLLFPTGSFSLDIAWGNFATSFILGIICLFFLLYSVVRHGDSQNTLFFIWSLILFAATLGQRRFAYYFAVNVALLTSYLIWSLIYGFVTRKQYVPVKHRKGETQSDIKIVIDFISKNYPMIFLILLFVGQLIFVWGYRFYRTADHFLVTEDFYEIIFYFVINLLLLAAYLVWKIFQFSVFKKATPIKTSIVQAGYKGIVVLVIFFNVIYPIVFSNDPAIFSPGGTIATASEARYAPNDAWQSSMLWLKDNTPDPFGNPDYYYEIQKFPPAGQSFQYPDSAYGVLAWWDYGYWITRIAHRIPYANPGQDPLQNALTARYFISQNETSAQEIIKTIGSTYVAIDFETATSKFWAMAVWAGIKQTDYFNVYYVPQENTLSPVILFHPEYYHALSTRLYNFDGKTVTPENTIVIAYEERSSPQGDSSIKLVRDVKQFTNYQEAETYMKSQTTGNYQIVSSDPFTSPVPLDAVKNYKLIHNSESLVSLSENKTISGLKIFEYIGQ
ncbi:MAG: STT3 domain-containing protein [Chloroflexota bacterium]